MFTANKSFRKIINKTKKNKNFIMSITDAGNDSFHANSYQIVVATEKLYNSQKSCQF